MSSVPVAAIKHPDGGRIVLLWEAAEEANEPDFIVDLELVSKRLTRRQKIKMNYLEFRSERHF
jgi:hypothetical protein